MCHAVSFILLCCVMESPLLILRHDGDDAPGRVNSAFDWPLLLTSSRQTCPSAEVSGRLRIHLCPCPMRLTILLVVSFLALALAVAPANWPATLSLPVIVRDFKEDHSDFEKFTSCGGVKGAIQSTLGEDGLPV